MSQDGLVKILLPSLYSEAKTDAIRLEQDIYKFMRVSSG